MEQDRRLGVLRRLQRFRRTLQHETAQWNLEAILSRSQEFSGGFILFDQVARHPYELGALAGEEEGETDPYSVFMTSRPS